MTSRPGSDASGGGNHTTGGVVVDWPGADDAVRYRLVLYDLVEERHRTVEGGDPRFAVPPKLVDPSHNHNWRIQYRDRPDGPWLELSPYLGLPGGPEPSEDHTVFEWPDQGTIASRVLIRDYSLGRIVLKVGVRGSECVVDWSSLDPRHVYRYRLQTWLDGAWAETTPYVRLDRAGDGRFPHRVRIDVPDPESIAALPAQRLEGERLHGGWTVRKKLARSTPSSLGHRNASYAADHPDRGEALLKAVDLTPAVGELTDLFEAERRLLDLCAAAGLSRIVTPLDRGEHMLPGEAIPVPYVLFERASEDLDTHLAAGATFEPAWALRTLEQVATGLAQLHSVGIAHADVSPSNVLIFADGSVKLTDLGGAVRRDPEADQGSPPQRGLAQSDESFTALHLPPELIYSRGPLDWRGRYQARDMYQLGSLVLYMFTKTTTTPAVLGKLDPNRHPNPKDRDYEAALPFVREAFEDVAEDLESAVAKSPWGSDLAQLFRELCDPDPRLRGDRHARDEGGSPYSLEPYVRRLGLLAARAEA